MMIDVCIGLCSMWSVGCVLVEMSTGQVLFPAKDGHSLIAHHVRLLGLPPVPMMQDSKQDKFQLIGQQWSLKDTSYAPKSRSWKSDIFGEQRWISAPLYYHLFVDLLSHMLTIDPNLRITPEIALKHDFFKLFITNKQHLQSQPQPQPPLQPQLQPQPQPQPQLQMPPQPQIQPQLQAQSQPLSTVTAVAN